jgi:kumamolisin
MIDDGVSVISNSWSSCEDQVSLADAQGIDSILQTAAMGGISVFNGSGDQGSTCLDGSPNTIGVPSDSPNATAVGGTTPTFALTGYGSETWWNGAAETPPSGQGGFGVSKFFSRPAYQNGLNPSGMRSVPDVVINSDPATGIMISDAQAGGCPAPGIYGGTSFAAPQWAAFAALLNQSLGKNIGNFNVAVYPFSNTNAFHDAASMGSDFSHVGIGSPNLNMLDAELSRNVAGIPDPTQSQVSFAGDVFGSTQVRGVPAAPADGLSRARVLVQLFDGSGFAVSGKTVTLSTTSSTAHISPSSAVTDVSNGTVAFTITDTVPETLTAHATDTSDGIPLIQTATIPFV